jgi:hypothetical protein
MAPDIKRYQDNLRDELNGAALYAALAAAESDPLRKDLFMQLAQAESSHAQLWRDKLSAAGVQDERFVPGFRTRRGRHAIFAVQWAQPLVFRGAPVDFRLPCGRSHVWNWGGAGHDSYVRFDRHHG